MKIHLNSAIFFALAAALFVGASYTQSGWQYIFLSILLACIVIGVILPFLTLRNIDVKKQIPSKMYVGKYSTVKIVFENKSKRAKRFININDTPISDINAENPSFNIKTILQSNPLKIIKKIDYSSMNFLKVLYGKDRASFRYSFLPSKRGLLQPGPVNISSSSPLGVFTRIKKYYSKQEVVVYPKVVNIRGGWVNRRAHMPIFTEVSRVFVPSTLAATTRSLREYVPGDSPKYIHWPSSAKLNKLQVREFEIESKGYIVIALDSFNKYETEEYYELAVVTAASLLNACHKEDIITRFITQNEAYTGFDNFIDSDWDSQLEVLARVKQVENNTLNSMIKEDSKKRLGFNPLYIIISHSSMDYKSLTTDNIVNICVAPQPNKLANYTISSEDDLRVI